MKWPLQSECDSFYGNPRGRDGNVSASWEAKNLVRVVIPWKAYYGHILVSKARIHRKCAESAQRILNVTWDKVGKSQELIKRWHLDDYNGSFNYRPIRDSNRLSMHAYGCAWDWDADENALGDRTPFFGYENPFVVAHIEEGWVWGGDWNLNKKMDEKRPDGMHFQAARIG